MHQIRLETLIKGSTFVFFLFDSTVVLQIPQDKF